jgi:hypothetical protein
MTTMTTTSSTLNDSYWDNNLSDPSSDFDDLFPSTYIFIYNNEHHHDSMSIKEEPKEISSLSSEVNIYKNVIDFIFISFNSDRSKTI